MDLSREQAVALDKLRSASAQYVVGIDEVGKGAWAGPLVVCGVVARKGWGHPKVRDSKKFKGDGADAARRKVLYSLIEPNIEMKFIGKVGPEEIDKEGIEKALEKLNTQVLRALVVHYPDSVVVADGLKKPECPEAKIILCLPKADQLVTAVSAASIIAKVYRDARMVKFHERWPGYDFYHNKGYHSEVHKAALEEHGPCDIHRFSFKPVLQAARSAPGIEMYSSGHILGSDERS